MLGNSIMGRTEYMSNHSVGTYTNTIPIPSGMQHALVFITQRNINGNSTSINDTSGLVCYIDNTINDVIINGRVASSNATLPGQWLYSSAGFITGKSTSDTRYTRGRYVLGVQQSYITDMAMTDSAITMTVNVESAEGDKGYGYFVDWTVW